MPDKPPIALTYKDSGVDVSAGAEAADQTEHLVKRTHSSRVLKSCGGCAGLFRLDFPEKLFARNYKEPVLISCANGVGTKIKIAAAMKKYDTVGIDLVALNINDLLAQGGEPLFFRNYLAQHKIDPLVTAQLLKGVSDGCMEAGCSLLAGGSGELAEMPDIYAAGNFDLSGFAVGVAEKSRLLDGTTIEAGDSVIGLASSGLHANGYALVRKIVQKTGLKFDAFVPELKCPLGEELLRPTRIYAKAVQGVLKNYRVKKIIKAMIHIAGGGLPGNLPRVLPEGFSVRIKRDAWDVPAIFGWLQKNGPVDGEEMLRVFNMGIGYVLIVRPTFTKAILSHLRALGEKPCFLGKVRKAPGEGKVEWS